MSDTKWYDYQRAVWESKVPWPHRGGLLALAFHANADGEGFPGNQTLADEILVSTKTVRNYTADMEHHGLITKVLRPGRSTVYRLNLEVIAAWDGGKLDAYRKRKVNFKKDRDGKPLAIPETDPVSGRMESHLPGSTESGLPDRGGKPLADITTRVNDPGTPTNGTSSESGTDEGFTREQAPLDEGPSPYEARLEKALQRGDLTEDRVCRGCQYKPRLHGRTSHCTTVPDSTPAPSVPVQGEATPKASPTGLAPIRVLSPCDNHRDRTGRTDNRSGARLCQECAPYLWNVA